MANFNGLAVSSAAIIAAAIVLFLGPLLIPKLHALKYGQSIREEGPKSHQKKSGTPTMGGLMMIPAICLASLLAAGFNPEILLALFVLIGHFAIGFADDYIKIVKKRNLGLTAKQKFLAQIVMASVIIYIGHTQLSLTTELWLPIVNTKIDLGSFYYLFVLLVLVGTTNAVNLTDGLDGLAAGTVAIASLAYCFIAYHFAHYPLVTFAAATASAAIAFLRFNAHPAKIFMGDTGSLALGGALAALALLTQTELLLAVVGLIFVIEALSVIIQVISFKTTGRRVFRMSPIHHHFELGGWKETKVVHTFWLGGVISALMALLML